LTALNWTQSTIKDFLRFQTPAHNSRVLGNGIDWPSVSVVERHGGRLQVELLLAKAALLLFLFLIISMNP
jgi:hypothetical protein